LTGRGKGYSFDGSFDVIFSGKYEVGVEEPSVSLLDYAYIWLKWRRFILWVVVVSTALALAVSLVLPKSYRAVTSILPPKPEMPASFSSAFSTFAATLDILNTGKTEEVNTYVALLESRRIREAAVQAFNLRAYYEKETMDETLKALASDLDIEVTKENTLVLSVVHQDSVKAAEIANFFIEELDRVNKTLANEQARNNRLFIEQRLAETRLRLREAEEALKTYQEDHRTLGLSEENRAALLAGAELEAEIMTLEVQQEVLRKNLGATHPMLSRIAVEIEAARRRLATLPELGLELARLFREVEIQTRLLAYLLPQYEQAKIQEVRDTPTIQVIDRAAPPQRKYAPKRLFIVAGAFVSSLLLSLFLTLRLESVHRARESRTPAGQKMERILEEWRALWPGR
jgi:uncharacterized protein involved in exopolysaccharide biosynthesis